MASPAVDTEWAVVAVVDELLVPDVSRADLLKAGMLRVSGLRGGWSLPSSGRKVSRTSGVPPMNQYRL